MTELLYVVASGKVVVTASGTKEEGEVVYLEDLEGADVSPERRLERLIRQGLLIKPKDDEGSE